MNCIIAATLLLAAGCSTEKNEPVTPDVPSHDDNVVTVGTTVDSRLDLDVRTDKAVYKPGETVRFSVDEMRPGAKVRYRFGTEVLAEHPLSAKTWEWTAPAEDFKGYMVDVYTGGDSTETVCGSIAVDVSSDWTMFPRYGFVATFDASKLAPGVIEKEMEYLNRCHINGVQFQDWHNKHHWPLGGTRTQLDERYTDIANREVVTEVVKRYIATQKSLGMKSIFYNLCFGALSDAASDGVKEEWYLFKDKSRGEKDRHTLPSSWKSDIYLVDPGNQEWQKYIGDRNDDVYANFDFDGYQIDQLGNRGTLYNYSGTAANLPRSYASFIDAMKARHPQKRLVMNAVSSYGAARIAGSGKVDFCYNEVWNDEPRFADLHSIIKANDSYSGGRLKTVFAAYMNYDKADKGKGFFNTPGVLMADAVMMALGGSHLELGDHMLSREYFPAAPLEMPDELREAIVRYYDFMTAYQNLLRQGGTETETACEISSADNARNVKFNVWPPQKGGVTSYSRKAGDRLVVNLLNFCNIDNLDWRDLDGKRPRPVKQENLAVKLNPGMKVSKIWCASPDYHGGVPVELSFRQEKGEVTLTLPFLNYWTMLVME